MDIDRDDLVPYNEAGDMVVRGQGLDSLVYADDLEVPPIPEPDAAEDAKTSSTKTDAKGSKK